LALLVPEAQQELYLAPLAVTLGLTKLQTQPQPLQQMALWPRAAQSQTHPQAALAARQLLALVPPNTQGVMAALDQPVPPTAVALAAVLPLTMRAMALQARLPTLQTAEPAAAVAVALAVSGLKRQTPQVALAAQVA
jgi:hypothetical protein